MLGLHVQNNDSILCRAQGGDTPESPSIMTWQTIFSVSGKLVGHFHHLWLAPHGDAYMKCRANMFTTGCDDEADDPPPWP